MLDRGSITTRGPEKREATRYALELAVLISGDHLVFEGSAELSGVTTDVSTAGLFVRSDLLEPVGTRVRVRLLVSDQEPIVLQGNVAWVSQEPPKGPGMGIALSRTERAYHQLIVAIARQQQNTPS